MRQVVEELSYLSTLSHDSRDWSTNGNVLWNFSEIYSDSFEPLGHIQVVRLQIPSPAVKLTRSSTTFHRLLEHKHGLAMLTILSSSAALLILKYKSQVDYSRDRYAWDPDFSLYRPPGYVKGKTAARAFRGRPSSFPYLYSGDYIAAIGAAQVLQYERGDIERKGERNSYSHLHI